MLQGQQVFPHKYVRRVKHGDRWDYVYAEAPKKPIKPQDEGLKEYKVVIAHQRPTPILVDSASHIVFGPPQTMGRRLFINTNPKKNYFGLAKHADGTGTPVYLYPESFLTDIKSKKAFKFLHASQALKLIDTTAENFMRSQNHVHQQYGLAIWLNNHSGLRIGAHEDAASVDAVERRRIINQARAEKWSDAAKEAALEAAREPTFGLLTTQVGHIKLDPQTHIAQWSFRSKGGKMLTGANVSVALPELQYNTLSKLISLKRIDEKVFPSVVYKHIWEHYKKYGITPHAARGALAEEMMSTLRKSFQKTPDESPERAYTRFKKAVKENISDKLGHTADMTLRAYISDETATGLNEAFQRSHPHLQEAGTVDGAEALANTILWLEVGPGNVVV